ncbi:MAG: uncharacterized membrane-anchored protein YhcB (DUF1043 family) [Oceanicoccus sp.]|jgi:uncharacterized membrane-anchored protein YhcB (DUF1043 family)
MTYQRQGFKLVYSLELLLTVGLAATIIGLAIGFVIAQRLAPSQTSQRQLETHLTEMQEQQENYQHEVSEHFVETADLLNQLTSSYRNVHNHLAKGAQQLAGDHVSDSLKTLADDSTSTNATNSELDLAADIMPPLDYAPKTAPNQTGMLNEEFGLDKEKRQEQLDVIIASEDRM